MVAARWAEYGLKPHQVEGILMNIDDESGFNSAAIGDNGNAVGLYQHNGVRMDGLKSYASERGLNYNDPLVQTDYAWHEFNTTEKSARDAIMKANTAGEAGDAFLRKFERPAEVHLNARSAKYLGNPQSTNSYASTSPETYNSNVQIGGNAPDYYGEAMALTSGGTPPVQAPAEQPKPKTKIGEFTAKHMPWLTEDRGDMLLAIGSGLLSGDDWASGAAAAGQNLLGVSQAQQERDANAAAAQQENERWNVAQAAQRLEHIEGLDHQRALREMDINAAERAAGAEAAAKAAERQAEIDAKGPQSVVHNGKEIKGVSQVYTDPNTGKVIPTFTEDLKTDDRKFVGYIIDGMDGAKMLDSAITQAGGLEGINHTEITRQLDILSREKGGGYSITATNIEDIARQAGIQDVPTINVFRATQKLINSKLRRDSGAAITIEEFINYSNLYLPRAGETPETWQQKRTMIDDDIRTGLTVAPAFTKDFLINYYAGTFDPAQGQEQGQPLAPGEVRTSTLPNPNATAPTVPAPSEEAVSNEVQRISAEAVETARRQTGYPDAVKAKGVSEEQWFKWVALADQADPNDPDAFTWDDLKQHLGLTDDMINNTPVNRR